MAASADEIAMQVRPAATRGQPSVRSLRRGLAILRAVSAHGPMSVAAIAARTGTPRVTTYRILLTLVDEGLIERRPDTSRYRLATAVRELSAGLEAQDPLAEIAAPVLARYCRELRWPLVLATNNGPRMVVRATTRHLTGVGLDDRGVGGDFPLLRSAAGQVFLAHCDPVLRRDLLAAALGEAGGEAASARPTAWGREFEAIRAQGYAYLPVSWTWRGANLSAIAVPLRVRGEVRAAVSLAYYQTAVTRVAALARFVAPLQAAAAEIALAIAAAPQGERGTSPCPA